MPEPAADLARLPAPASSVPAVVSPSAIARAADGRFLPGTPSANPGGIPRWVREIRERAAGHSPRAVDTLVKLLGSKSEMVRLEAASRLLGFAGVKAIAADGEFLEVRSAAGDSVSILAGLIARRVAAGAAPAARPELESAGAGDPQPAGR